MSSQLTRYKGVLVFGFFFFLLDIITKQLVVHLFDLGQESVVVADFFGCRLSITYATNTGAAWGVFGDFPDLLLALRVVLIFGLVVYLAFFLKIPAFRLPLVLIIFGALGNVLDFFIYGHVVDMVHCQFWGYDYPVFNVADSMIFVGTIALLVISFWTDDKQHT